MTKQIPLRNDFASYLFSILLEKKLYFFKIRFNTRLDLWAMDILTETQEPIYCGIPMLVNIPLTLGLNSTLAPPGEFFLIDETGKDRNPDRFTLGVDLKLEYVESV
jgi:hypothetical protein